MHLRGEPKFIRCDGTGCMDKKFWTNDEFPFAVAHCWEAWNGGVQDAGNYMTATGKALDWELQKLQWEGPDVCIKPKLSFVIGRR